MGGWMVMASRIAHEPNPLQTGDSHFQPNPFQNGCSHFQSNPFRKGSTHVEPNPFQNGSGHFQLRSLEWNRLEMARSVL